MVCKKRNSVWAGVRGNNLNNSQLNRRENEKSISILKVTYRMSSKSHLILFSKVYISSGVLQHKILTLKELTDFLSYRIKVNQYDFINLCVRKN